MNKKTAFLLLAMVCSSLVWSQTIYYCVKDGKKIATDRGCGVQGAVEQKRVEYRDLPPVNTSQSLTPSEVQQGQIVDERMRQERVVDDGQRKKNIVMQQRADARNREICLELGKKKDHIISMQRHFSNDYWNEKHRWVNDEIYRRRCETM